MGADLDFSPPPPPEPALSPEPEILAPDHQSWKAEMMSALGESVSFGRFLAEPLEWGRWSAFAHNRYLEEAAHQSRPGSVAQKKAFFEAHYARKRKTDADADATGSDVDPDEANAAAAAAVSSARSSSSSCMTDEPAAEETTSCVVGSGVVAAGPVEEMVELDVITDGGVGSYCGVNADEAAHHKQDGALVGESRDVLQAMERQKGTTHDPCADNSVPADADDKQPLKESSIVNQGSAESVKRRRLPSLLQKPAKFSSPSSGSKGPASSAKRRSRLHSSKENSSPPNNESDQQATSSVPQNRSILEAFQKSKNFGRCETGNAASSSKNLGTTIAARISQLESATGPVKHTDSALSQVKPPIEAFPKDVSEITSRTSQLEEQRSSHVTRVKEKLFGFTSQSAHQKANTPRKEKGKTQNESFKARPLPNFYRRNKQAKDSSHQVSMVPNVERTRDRSTSLYR
ncbi:protein WVD2-like 7 isoform X2 [Oryza glaberrima]|uniref:TPX2 C-terminal domain-containing protein n=1 Tax=Oryza barthii TaxID=65489 RepID=A0A0D3HT72_9ORYZ|nr:protein WVD2-like 7 isoform X2 [Oryza glaberrima]